MGAQQNVRAACAGSRKETLRYVLALLQTGIHPQMLQITPVEQKKSVQSA